MKLPPHYRPKHPDWERLFGQLPHIKTRGFPVCLSGCKGTGKEFSARLVAAALGIPESQSVFLAPETFEPAALEKARPDMVVFIQRGEVPSGRQEDILRLLKALREGLQVVWISATSLGRQLETGALSEELFYALNIFDFQLPDLADMPADMEGFANHFLAALGEEAGLSKSLQLAPDQVRLLKKQSWPANLDTLQFVLKRSVALSPASRLELDLAALPRLVRAEDAEDLQEDSAGDTVSGVPVDKLEKSVNEFKRKLVLETLKKAGGNKSQAAKLLGVSKAYVFRLMHMLEIKLD